MVCCIYITSDATRRALTGAHSHLSERSTKKGVGLREWRMKNIAFLFSFFSCVGEGWRTHTHTDREPTFRALPAHSLVPSISFRRLWAAVCVCVCARCAMCGGICVLQWKKTWKNERKKRYPHFGPLSISTHAHTWSELYLCLRCFYSEFEPESERKNK